MVILFNRIKVFDELSDACKVRSFHCFLSLYCSTSYLLVTTESERIYIVKYCPYVVLSDDLSFRTRCNLFSFIV